MFGLVGVLASALLGIMLVFIVMLLSYLKALLAPTDGEYKLEVDTGLMFPIEAYMLNEEILSKMLSIYREGKGVDAVDVGISCTYGKQLDKLTSGRYATYNYVFLSSYKENVDKEIKAVESYGLGYESDVKKNKCWLRVKDHNSSDESFDHDEEALGKNTIEANVAKGN